MILTVCNGFKRPMIVFRGSLEDYAKFIGKDSVTYVDIDRLASTSRHGISYSLIFDTIDISCKDLPRKVRFIQALNSKPHPFLKPGELYEMTELMVGDFFSKISLKEFKGLTFSSCMFSESTKYKVRD